MRRVSLEVHVSVVNSLVLDFTNQILNNIECTLKVFQLVAIHLPIRVFRMRDFNVETPIVIGGRLEHKAERPKVFDQCRLVHGDSIP